MSPLGSLRTAWLTMVLLSVAALAMVAAGCGDDDDDDGGNGSAPTATNEGSEGEGGNDSDNDGDDDADDDGDGDSAGGEAGGTITVGDDTWTFVPSTQCRVFPGPVAAIAGHAAEDESVEIVIDYDADGDLVAAAVNINGNTFRAEGDDVSMEVDGNTVTGSGTFRPEVSGEPMEGSFEVTCQ